jgi:hypothetical protein
MKTLQMTEAGKQRVATLEFAEIVRDAIADISEERLGQGMALTLIGWAMAGQDVSQPPKTPDELTALAVFIERHRSQIEAVADAMVITLAAHDSAGCA